MNKSLNDKQRKWKITHKIELKKLFKNLEKVESTIKKPNNINVPATR